MLIYFLHILFWLNIPVHITLTIERKTKCVQFGDITYPLNVMPAMDHEWYYNNGYSLPAMLPISSIAAPQTGHLQTSLHQKPYSKKLTLTSTTKAHVIHPSSILPFHDPSP